MTGLPASNPSKRPDADEWRTRADIYGAALDDILDAIESEAGIETIRDIAEEAKRDG